MATFRPKSSFSRDVADSPAVKAVLFAHAELIKRHAEAIMPRGTADPHIADEFVVVEEDGAIRVGNRSPWGHLAEYGSANNPPYAPLRRAAQAAGLELREAPKG